MKSGVLSLVILILIGLILGLMVSGLPATITILILGVAFISYLVFYYPVLIVTVLLCLVPFNVLWSGVSITPLEIAYGLTYILLAILWILRKIIEIIFKGKTESLNSPITLPFGVFFCVTMLSCMIGILQGYKFPDWGSALNALLYYGLGFILLDVVKNKKILYNILLLMLISTVLGMLKEIYTEINTPYTEIEFVGSEFPKFRHLIEIAFVAFMISVAIAINSTRRGKKFIFMILAIFFGVMQLASFGRSFWISAVFSLAFLFFASFTKQKTNFVKFILVIITLFSIYAGAAVLLPSNNRLLKSLYAIEKRFYSIFTAKDEPSMRTRDSEWIEAKRKALEHPFLGNGLGTKITYFRYDKWYIVQIWQTTRYIHNTYLYLFLNMGILGLLSFLWLFVSLIKYSFTLYMSAEDEMDKAVSVGITCAIIALMIASMAGPLLISPTLTMWIGFFIGSLIILDRAQKKLI